MFAPSRQNMMVTEVRWSLFTDGVLVQI